MICVSANAIRVGSCRRSTRQSRSRCANNHASSRRRSTDRVTTDHKIRVVRLLPGALCRSEYHELKTQTKQPNTRTATTTPSTISPAGPGQRSSSTDSTPSWCAISAESRETRRDDLPSTRTHYIPRSDRSAVPTTGYGRDTNTHPRTSVRRTRSR
jgi:hypothetical protein